MKTLTKIVFLLILAVFSGTLATAQPSNPSNYCSWMYDMLGPGKYFTYDTLKICSGFTVGGGRSNTLPNTTYRRNDGVTYTSDSSGRLQSPPLTSAGLYWWDITKDGCTARDSLYVLYVTPPVVYLGNDTTLCHGDSLVLNAGNAGASFIWNSDYNSTNQKQTYVVKDAGKYRVTVTVPGCSSSDVIEVNYKAPVNFSLGPDQLICEGESVLLYPGIVDAKYLWQDGSTFPAFTVSGPGTYSVRMDDACGTQTDVINFKEGICKLYVPTAFTPNNDGKNDLFKVLGQDNISFFRLKVYNRWGTEVFITSFPDRGWDGTVKGQTQPTGVYIWILEYKKKYKQESFQQKGTVLLIR